MTGFWRDKFDFITVHGHPIRDATGRETRARLPHQRRLRPHPRRRGELPQADRELVPGPDHGVVLPRHRPLVHQQRRASSSSSTRAATSTTPSRRRSRGTARSTSRRTSLFSYDREHPFLGVPGAQPLPALRLDHVPQRAALHARRRSKAASATRSPARTTGGRSTTTCSDPADRFSDVGAPWWWFDLNSRAGHRRARQRPPVDGGGDEPLQPEERRHRQPRHRRGLPRRGPVLRAGNAADLRGNPPTTCRRHA